VRSGFACPFELVRDRDLKTPLATPNVNSTLPMQIRRYAWQEGLHLVSRRSLLVLAPPLILGQEYVAEGIAKLEKVLAWVDEQAGN
jgi:adenosylmethionine-8-amino-7-oxononanoate aminotransferase